MFNATDTPDNMPDDNDADNIPDAEMDTDERPNPQDTDDPDDPENKNCSASRYNYSDDPRDQFVMLSSFTTMLSESARRR